MKKDISLLIGIAALALSIFVAAFLFYDGAGEKPSTSPARADESRLLKDDAPTLGPSLAKVTLVEFLDPECEACAAMHPIVKRVMSEFPGRVRLVIRYMPFHGNSAYAAAALEAAALQGKYWEALDTLFEKQAQWGSHHNPQPELIPGFLESIGIDLERLLKDMENPAFAQKIERDKNDGLALGVRATPTFYVNGQLLRELGYLPLRNRVQEALEE
jgi:protein-disulfide isomerase